MNERGHVQLHASKPRPQITGHFRKPVDAETWSRRMQRSDAPPAVQGHAVGEIQKARYALTPVEVK